MELRVGSVAFAPSAGSGEPDWIAYWHGRIAGTAAYDVAIKAIFSLWFFFIAYRVLHELLDYLGRAETLASPALFITSIASRIAVLFFLLSFVIFTVLRSRPIAKAPGFLPRITAFAGTFSLMVLPFFPHRTLSVEMNVLSTFLTLAGSSLAIYVLCHLGRSVSIMAEARRLVTDGPYRHVRHPLYLAEEVAVIGAFLQYLSPWTALLVCIHWLLQMARMRHEEKVLSATLPGYGAYMHRTARLIPGIY
jgi:protein-S-isoprenylcysteine O-methyltransferase Ste14